MNGVIEEMIGFNAEFVKNREYERYMTDKYPDKRIAIVTCMDTRLVELLPAALGIKNGDAKIIKNAGAVISSPFDSAMRSLLVAVYELKVNEIMIIGHTDCGVRGMDGAEMKHLMEERGIPHERIELLERSGVDLDSWLSGFTDTRCSVLASVDIVRNHPLMPSDVSVSGYIMDSVTGALSPVN